MKKAFVFAMFIASASVAMAAETARATIKITSVGGGVDQVTIVENSDNNATMENGSDVTKIMNSGLAKVINFYAVCGWGNAAAVYDANVDGLPFTFISNKIDTKYTMTFSNVNGRALQMYDARESKVIDIANGVTYDFSQAKEDTVANRFRIYEGFTADDGELIICHENGALVIKNNPYTSNIVITKYNAPSEVVLTRQPLPTPQTISNADIAQALADLQLEPDKDKQYRVRLDDGKKEFVIKVE